MGLFRRTRSDRTGESTATLPTDISIGVPGRCPSCDGFGYIDSIDVIANFQHQHCPACGFHWEYRFDGEGNLVERIERGTVLIDLTEPSEPSEVIDLTDEPEPAPDPAPADEHEAAAEPAPADQHEAVVDSAPAADWLRQTTGH